MGGVQDQTLPSRATAIIYLFVVSAIFVVLVWGYCNLFRPKQLDNPGLSAYRPPPGTMLYPLVQPELVAGSEAVRDKEAESVPASAKAGHAKEALAFSDGDDLHGASKNGRAKLKHYEKGRPRLRRVMITLSSASFSHFLRNRALGPRLR